MAIFSLMMALFTRRTRSSNCSDVNKAPNFISLSTSSDTKMADVVPCLRESVTTVMYFRASKIFPLKMASKQEARESTSRCRTEEVDSSVILFREGALRRGT